MSLKRILFSNLFLACFILRFEQASQTQNNWLLNGNHVASFETDGPRVTLKQEPHRSDCYNAMYLGLIASNSSNYWEFTCTGTCKVKLGISKRTDFADYDQIKGEFGRFLFEQISSQLNKFTKTPENR